MLHRNKTRFSLRANHLVLPWQTWKSSICHRDPSNSNQKDFIMFEQFNNQVLSFSKQFAESMIKANTVAVDHFEKIVDVQLKGFEDRLSTVADFVETAAVVKSPEDMRALLPKGVAFVKTAAEKQVALNQELTAITTRTTEQLVSLVKGQFEVANDAVTKTVKAAKK
jgi:hypothetical protein